MTTHPYTEDQLVVQPAIRLFATLPNPPEVSTTLRGMHPQAELQYKGAYLLDFLYPSDPHSESDSHRSLLMNLSRFLTELGRDFYCIGSEYPIQVGSQDFAIDLLFSVTSKNNP